LYIFLAILVVGIGVIAISMHYRDALLNQTLAHLIYNPNAPSYSSSTDPIGVVGVILAVIGLIGSVIFGDKALVDRTK
jgi:hypothetical protein